MCFSPVASFSAGVVLCAAGVVSLVRSRTPAQRVLSGIPLIFAVQQFAEGVLWLALSDLAWAHLQLAAMYAFLVFAQMVWPVYLPFAILLFETQPARRKAIRILCISGLLFAAYIGFCLYYYPVGVAADQHHIRYDLGFALAHKWYYGLLYFIPTILAPLISGVKKLHWLGYLFLGSYIVTRLLFHYYVVSVWCFFGAVISLLVLYIVVSLTRTSVKENELPV